MKRPLIHATASIAVSSILIASMPPSSAEESHEHACKVAFKIPGTLSFERALPAQLGPTVGGNQADRHPQSLKFQSEFDVPGPKGCPKFRYVHSQLLNTTVLLEYFKSDNNALEPEVDGFLLPGNAIAKENKDNPVIPGFPRTRGVRFEYDNTVFNGPKRFLFEEGIVQNPSVTESISFKDKGSLTAYVEGEYHFEEVPGPLPLLGVAAGFSYSRKLRKRLKSNKLPVVSADD